MHDNIHAGEGKRNDYFVTIPKAKQEEVLDRLSEFIERTLSYDHS